VTAQGHPSAIFKRAIERVNVLVAEATAREIGLSLEEALQLVLLYAAYEPANGARGLAVVPPLSHPEHPESLRRRNTPGRGSLPAPSGCGDGQRLRAPRSTRRAVASTGRVLAALEIALRSSGGRVMSLGSIGVEHEKRRSRLGLLLILRQRGRAMWQGLLP
jgi:hypothetical protein